MTHIPHIVVIGPEQKPLCIFSAPVAMGKLARYKFKYRVKEQFPNARKVNDSSSIGFHFIVENPDKQVVSLILSKGVIECA